VVAVGSALAAGGCQPDFGTPASLVTSLRILAVSETPAEAAPGAMVGYAALLVDGSGERPDLAAKIDWAFCNQPKPLSELADVTSACFTYGQPYLTEVGTAASLSSALPQGACALFGPDVPPAMMGMPAGRPADPDPTGGYYQPMRLILQTEDPPGTPVTVLGAGESRIICGLPGVGSDTLAMFKMAYKPNQNPELAGVTAGGTTLAPDDGQSPGLPVSAGTKITLTASWPSCPAPAMHGCGAEDYAYYDPQMQLVTMRREALTVSWFTTAGSFDADRTGVADDDMAASADNGWTAPNASTPGVLLWVVLRDDRGGVTWKRYRIDVT
jgi:hypothetical protein